MIDFIKSQGYSANGLDKITFNKGTVTAETVFSAMGNPAITVGNQIHVTSSAWDWISTPSGGPTYFEEIIHTLQYDSWGMIGFGTAYGVAAAIAKFKTGDAHNNPIENQAIIISNQLSRAYKELPSDKKCQD